MHIDFFIKDIRTNKKISLSRLATISNVSKSHINDIENNFKNPSLYNMILISHSLKLPITDLYKVYW